MFTSALIVHDMLPSALGQTAEADAEFWALH